MWGIRGPEQQYCGGSAIKRYKHWTRRKKEKEKEKEENWGGNCALARDGGGRRGIGIKMRGRATSGLLWHAREVVVT